MHRFRPLMLCVQLWQESLVAGLCVPFFKGWPRVPISPGTTRRHRSAGTLSSPSPIDQVGIQPAWDLDHLSEVHGRHPIKGLPPGVRPARSAAAGGSKVNSFELIKIVTENLKNVLREPLTEAAAQQSLMAITLILTQHTMMTGQSHDIVCQQTVQLQQVLRSSRIDLKWKEAISWDRRFFRTVGELAVEDILGN